MVFREGFKYSHKKTRKIKWIDFLVFFLKNCIVLQTFFSYDNYSYEGEYIPPADDNYYCTEPPEDFDYNELNEIYENEVYNFD